MAPYSMRNGFLLLALDSQLLLWALLANSLDMAMAYHRFGCMMQPVPSKNDATQVWRAAQGQEHHTQVGVLWA